MVHVGFSMTTSKFKDFSEFWTGNTDYHWPQSKNISNAITCSVLQIKKTQYTLGSTMELQSKDLEKSPSLTTF